MPKFVESPKRIDILSFKVIPPTFILSTLKMPPVFVMFATNVSVVKSLKLKSNSRFDLPFKFTLPRFVDEIFPSITSIAPPFTFNEDAFDISAFGPNVI